MAGDDDTLIGRILANAAKHPDKVAFRFLDDSGKDKQAITYKELEQRTANLARYLRSQNGAGLAEGEPVMLVYPPSADFILAFLACLRAGVIAVPVYPPDPRRMKKHQHMFIAVQGRCGARTALTNSAYNWAKRVSGLKAAFSHGSGEAWPEMRWVVTDKASVDARQAAKEGLETDQAPREAVAFLQFTSGSTADPKGVIITHSNLAHNLGTIVRSLNAGPDTSVVSWLPQFHDMGLIGAQLGVLYCGGSGAYVSPVAFIKDPPLWIRAMSAHRATHVQAPNFAFKLAARKWRARRPRAGDDAVDLSSLRHLFNAAEPIDVGALDDFLDTFEPLGLRPDCISPGYGLAEHTVYVCDGGDTRLRLSKVALEQENTVASAEAYPLARREREQGAVDPSTSSVLVSCGDLAKNEDVQVVIADPDTCLDLGTDRVGEIWVQSASAARGYWGQEDLTREAFHAELAPAADGDAGDEGGGAGDGADRAARGPFLRTGDLGFIHDGQLYVCGRLKDLIIVRGRNHFPQDLERTAEQANDALRPGCSAAFSVTMSDAPGQAHRREEGVVLVAELRDPAAVDAVAVRDALRRQLAHEHGVSLVGVALLKPRTNAKTTSGKIARRRCRTAWTQGTFDSVHTWAAGEEEEEEGVDSGAVEAEELGSPKETAGSSRNGGAADALETEEPVGMDGLTVDALVADLCDILGRSPREVPADVPMADLGVDSLGAAQLKGLLEQKYGAALDDEVLYDGQVSISQLVAVAHRGGSAEVARKVLEEAGADAVAPRVAHKPKRCPCC